MICRYCGKEGATIVTLCYWNQTPAWCHDECKVSGERQEAIDCQTIDADCNDCLYYQRGQQAPKVVSSIRTPRGKTRTVTYQPNTIINGHCKKFNKPTTAYPHTWTGMECFEHRRQIP